MYCKNNNSFTRADIEKRLPKLGEVISGRVWIDGEKVRVEGNVIYINHTNLWYLVEVVRPSGHKQRFGFLGVDEVEKRGEQTNAV